jgi:transposase-like protein
MERKNRYYRRAHISERKFRQLLDYLARDLSAADVAQLTGLTRKTVTTIFLKIRQRIAQESARDSPLSPADLKVAAEDFQRASRAGPGEAANGVSGDFCAFARKRLSKFRGISEHTLQLHLRESEWRFNRRYEHGRSEQSAAPNAARQPAVIEGVTTQKHQGKFKGK